MSGVDRGEEPLGGRTAPFEDAWRFLLTLGTSAHVYGCTAPRLEIFLGRLSTAFGFQGVFRSTPSEMVFAVNAAPDGPQRIEVVATPPSGLDLNKLAHVGELVNEVAAGAVSLAEASTRLGEIDRIPTPWGVVANALSYVLTGLGLTTILGGSWSDAVAATLLSVLVYGLVLLSGRIGGAAEEWLPLSTAFVAGASTAAIKVAVPDLNLVLVILAAIAVLLPGYTISLGTIELVGQHVVSGTANLVGGLVYLVKQVAGAWLGVMAVRVAVSIPTGGSPEPIGSGWQWLIVPLLILGLCVVFQTSRRDLPWAFLVCGIAYLGILAGSALVDGNFGNLLGTTVAVVCANGWARATERPTSIVLIPAIILLVSGSIGFRGLAAATAGQIVAGQQQFLQMFVVALTIWAGLLIGNTLVRPEPTL